MATGTLINDTNYAGSFELGKRTGTLLTLQTLGQYLSKNVALTLSAQSATPAFDGGTLNNKSATATFTNATTSTTNTSGVAIQAKGAAGRDALLYNGAVEGWVSANDDAVASAAIASSEWNGTTYYLTGVNIDAPASGTKEFSITVPNGDEGNVTFYFIVDASGNTYVGSTGGASTITWATGGAF